VSRPNLQIAVTIAEACAALRISESSIYRLFRSGKLTKRKIAGRVLIDIDELRALLAASAVSVPLGSSPNQS
jgi:excisionase family DNA binding protein